MRTYGKGLGFVLAATFLVAAGCDDCQATPPAQKDADNQVVDCDIDQSFDYSTAVDIVPGEELSGTICPEGFDDRDYFKLNSGDNQLLEIRLRNETGVTSVDLRAAVLNDDGSGTPMSFSNSNGSGAPTDISQTFSVDKNTTYIIEVSDEGGDDGDPMNPYFIEIALSPEPDSHEPNNTAEQSTTDLCNGTPITGFIASGNDVDHYTCTASTKPGRVNVRFVAGADLGWQPYIRVVNGPGGEGEGTNLLDIQVHKLEDGSYDYQASVAVIAAVTEGTRSRTGEVYVIVEDVYEPPSNGHDFNFESSGTYTLTISADSGPGSDSEPAERNDFPGSATAVGTGSTSGFLATVGDVDWYKVEGQAGSVMEIVLDLPNDGYIPMHIDEDRVGINFEIYDAHLNVAGNSTSVAGCTPGGQYTDPVPCNPGADECGGAQYHGEQTPVCLADGGGGFCGEMRHSTLVLQGADANRVPRAESYRAAVAVLQSRPIYVAINHFQSAVYHEGSPYTLTFNQVAEPDSHEPNDLPPNLNREARYSSQASSIRQCNTGHFPVENIGGYSGAGACEHPERVCVTPDGGNDDACSYEPPPSGGCLPWNNESSEYDGGTGTENPFVTLDCSSAGTGTYTTTGYLSFLGDRDYYTFNLPPGDLQVNVDVVGSGGSTGVEMGVFVFAGGRLHGSFVDARQTAVQSQDSCDNWQDCCPISTEPCERDCVGGFCERPRRCLSHTECPEDFICIRERCFMDTDSHATPNVSFGPPNNCLMATTCGEPNPWVIEVTDNGQNDYDLNMQYTLTVRWDCTCPGRCGYCTAPLSMRECVTSSR